MVVKVRQVSPGPDGRSAVLRLGPPFGALHETTECHPRLLNGRQVSIFLLKCFQKIHHQSHFFSLVLNAPCPRARPLGSLRPTTCPGQRTPAPTLVTPPSMCPSRTAVTNLVTTPKTLVLSLSPMILVAPPAHCRPRPNGAGGSSEEGNPEMESRCLGCVKLEPIGLSQNGYGP